MSQIREEEEETGNELKVLCCTANMGNAKPTARHVAAWIPPHGILKDRESSLSSSSLVLPFDLIVVGMQEATWKTKKKQDSEAIVEEDESWDSEEEERDDGDDKTPGAVLQLTPSQMSSSSEHSGKPSPSKSSDTCHLRNLLQDNVGDEYKLLKEYQRGQMRLYVIVRQAWVDEIHDLEVKAENTGIAGVYHNKGGILVQFCVRQTRLTFGTAHLAAHEGVDKYKTRNDHVREIFRGARPNPKHLMGYDAATVSHHMMFMGDLNYRVRVKAAAEDTHEAKVAQAMELIEARDFETLYSLDELSAGLHNKEVLCQFQTPPCHFSPTFKMLREEGFHYKTQRVPSYTDRILYTSAEHLADNLKLLSYEPCPGFASSDHKPIRGAFSINLNGSASAESSNDDEMTEPVSLTFRDMKCSELPAMDVDGSSDPYIMFVCDPPNLVKDDRNPKNQKANKGRSEFKWPRTAYMKKTLNPSWDEQVKLCILPESAHQMNGAMLFVTVMDYDMSTHDDTMCCLALNLKELVSLEDGETSKMVTINRPLLKYGQEQGIIQCIIDVQRGGIEHASRHAIKKGFFGLGKRRK